MHNNHKPCTDCKRILPLKDFYTTTSRKLNSKTYYSSRCKQCDVQSYKTRFNASYKSRATTLFNGVKSRCRRMGVQYSISRKDIIHQYELQNGRCYYSGRSLSPVSGDDNIMSIDRKNSSLGYTPENIVICSWRVNKMKNDCSIKDFMALCRDICRFSKEI